MELSGRIWKPFTKYHFNFYYLKQSVHRSQTLMNSFKAAESFYMSSAQLHQQWCFFCGWECTHLATACANAGLETCNICANAVVLHTAVRWRRCGHRRHRLSDVLWHADGRWHNTVAFWHHNGSDRSSTPPPVKWLGTRSYHQSFLSLVHFSSSVTSDGWYHFKKSKN